MFLQMHIVLENSKKKIVLKQKLFIGNWDKNTNINSKQCADTSANNDSPNGKFYDFHYIWLVNI